MGESPKNKPEIDKYILSCDIRPSLAIREGKSLAGVALIFLRSLVSREKRKQWRIELVTRPGW